MQKGEGKIEHFHQVTSFHLRLESICTPRCTNLTGSEKYWKMESWGSIINIGPSVSHTRILVVTSPQNPEKKQLRFEPFVARTEQQYNDELPCSSTKHFWLRASLCEKIRILFANVSPTQRCKFLLFLIMVSWTGRGFLTEYVHLVCCLSGKCNQN